MTTISASGGFIIDISQSGDGTISYTGAVSGTISSWPVTFVNSNPSSELYIKIGFSTNINLTGGADRYFICGSTYIQIGNDLLNTDGTQTVITIDGITDYPGLIQNGDLDNNGTNDVIIQNIGVKIANGSTLLQGGGWIGQQYFSNSAINNQITNCYSTGPISSSSGGIIGQYAALSGSLTIINCYSTGNTSLGSSNSGLIVGLGAVSSGSEGELNISNCFSTGSISNGIGGILGYGSGGGGIININNCYSTGLIGGTGAGGIIGAECFNTTISNCYSTGRINGLVTGGICGVSNENTVLITNCYSAGLLAGSNAGGIFPVGSTPTINNCYVANGSWNDVSANSALTGEPTTTDVGITWVRTDGANTPYKLISIGYSPYSRSLVTTYSQTINSGESSAHAIVTGHTFQILAINGSSPTNYPGITIDATTGAIQAASTVTTDTYSIVVYDYINPYAITLVEVEVNGITIVIPSYCCPVTTNANFPSYEIKESIKDYKGMNYDAQNYGKKVFNSYSDYIKYKMTRNYICQ